MTELEDLLYQLETLASHDPVDLDYPSFEVAYEDASGADVWVDVCVIDLAERVLKQLSQTTSEEK